MIYVNKITSADRGDHGVVFANQSLHVANQLQMRCSHSIQQQARRLAPARIVTDIFPPDLRRGNQSVQHRYRGRVRFLRGVKLRYLNRVHDLQWPCPLDLMR